MDSNFEDIIDFLDKFEWIYNFKLTDFFIDRVWENIPAEWVDSLLALSVEELNELPFGKIKDSWPESLKEFVQTAIKFSISRCHSDVTTTSDIDADLKKGMNPKKQHEVTQMAALVNDLAIETKSELIVDVGSGLGYLGQILNRKYGHKVLGIEGKQSHTSRADHRLSAREGIKNVTCELSSTAESMKNFQEILIESTTSNIESSCLCNHGHQGEITSLYNQRDKGEITTSKMSETVLISDGKLQTNRESTVCNCCKEKQKINEISNGTKRIPVKSCHGNCVQDAHDTSQAHTASSKVLNSEISCTSNRLQNIEDCVKHMEENSTVINTSEDLKLVKNTKTIPTMGDSPDAILDVQHQISAIPKVLMIGLHCCGDLTPTMMRFFTELDFIRGLCCVSCCYHRMNFDATKNKFDNFPLSASLCTVLSSKRDWNLNLYAMRLGAQETRARWKTQIKEDHDYHMKNVAFRGILELFSKQEKYDSNKLFRKLTRKEDMSSFSSYINAVINRTKLDNTGTVKNKLQEIYSINERYFDYIEPFTALQVIIQPVIESLINMDRYKWIHEQGTSSNVIPLFNDSISPRNLALIAIKK